MRLECYFAGTPEKGQVHHDFRESFEALDDADKIVEGSSVLRSNPVTFAEGRVFHCTESVDFLTGNLGEGAIGVTEGAENVRLGKVEEGAEVSGVDEKITGEEGASYGPPNPETAIEDASGDSREITRITVGGSGNGPLFTGRYPNDI